MKHLILLCALALPAALHGQVIRNWTGGAGNWSDPAKWSGVPAGIPAANDTVGISLSTPVVTLDTNGVADSLTMSGSTIQAGAADQSLTIGGLWDMSQGITRLGGVGAGRLTFLANGGMTFRNASSAFGLDNIVINLASGQSAIQQDNVGGITTSVRNGTVINNAGTYEARSNGGLSFANVGAACAFNNSGTFTRNTATGEWFTSMSFNNSGTVNANTGTLRLEGGGTSAGGLFNIASGATLKFAGTHSFDAASGISGAGKAWFNHSGSATLSNYSVTGTTEVQTGTVTLNNGAGSIGAVAMSGGTANFNGTASPTALTMSSGTAAFANDITVAGVTPLNGGTLSLAAGRTCIFNGSVSWSNTLSGGTFHFNGGASNSSGLPQLNAATLNIPAGQTVTIANNSGGNSVLSNGAVINNSGTWIASGSMGVNAGSGTMGAFNNSGTFNRSTSSADLSIGVPFTNTSTVNVTSGSIRFNNAYTQTAGSLVLNGGSVKGAFGFTIQIQGGSLTGAATLNVDTVAVTSGTLRPRGILTIRGPNNETTSGNLTLTSASTLDMELGGTTAGTQYDQVIENGLTSVPANAFARNGTLALRFKNNFQYSILNSHTFTLLTSNQNTTGQFANVSAGRVTTADFKGTFAINAAGTTSVVLSDFQGYPDLDVEQPAGNDLADNAATVNFGLRTIGTPGVTRTFTIKNTGAANLTGLAISFDGPHAADFAVTTPLPGSTLAQEGMAEFIVTFTPSGSGIRTAALHIASNDPNEAPFDIALTGEGNFAPELQLPLTDVEVEPTDINGAIVNFTVGATDFEDNPDPDAIPSPAGGSQFPLGDSTVIVSATDSRGVTTTGTFTVRVLGGNPSATTLAPTDITISSATLRATVNPNHFATSVQFVLDGQPRNPPVNVPAGSSPVTVTFAVSGLQPGSAHTANVQAINATGQFIDGGTVNFTTLGGPPSVVTNAPTMITPTKARLTATVNPNDLPTSVGFYVNGQLVGTVNVAASNTPQLVTFDYQSTSLIPGQSGVFNAIGINPLAQTGVSGDDQNFQHLASDSTIGSANSFLYAANAGWVHAKPATSYGFRTGDTVCSGFLYAANCGWIHAGTGEPADGIQYTNTGGDYGVNVMPDGALRGYAWSGNIGWITFESVGNPSIDLGNGSLTGYAWSGNIGWIQLSTATTTQLAILDTDGDGISDAWERDQSSNLTSLSANHDSDGDGVSDFDEFLADTDPFDSADQLRITSFVKAPVTGLIQLSHTSRATRLYRIETSTALSPPWTDAGLGWFFGSLTGSTSVNLGSPADPARFYRVAAKRPLAP